MCLMMALGPLALDTVSIQHHWNLTLPKVSYDNLSWNSLKSGHNIYRDLSLLSSFATRSRVCNSGSLFQSNVCHLFFCLGWDLAAVCTIGMSIILVAWENSWHLATLLLVSPPNDAWESPYWWCVTTQIWVVLLIGHAAWEIWFNR